MKYSIGRWEDKSLLAIGNVVVNGMGSIEIETDDDTLKKYLEAAIKRGIKATMGMEGINMAGNHVLGEVDIEVSPHDKAFIGALQRNLPPGYLVLDLLGKNQQQRKTA